MARDNKVPHFEAIVGNQPHCIRTGEDNVFRAIMICFAHILKTKGRRQIQNAQAWHYFAKNQEMDSRISSFEVTYGTMSLS